MTTTTIRDAEITVVGLTLVVDYHYYSGCPRTEWQPADEPSVEILRVTVKGQPTADVHELLEAIKLHPKIFKGDVIYESGYDLIEQHILENPPT